MREGTRIWIGDAIVNGVIRWFMPLHGWQVDTSRTNRGESETGKDKSPIPSLWPSTGGICSVWDIHSRQPIPWPWGRYHIPYRIGVRGQGNQLSPFSAANSNGFTKANDLIRIYSYCSLWLQLAMGFKGQCIMAKGIKARFVVVDSVIPFPLFMYLGVGSRTMGCDLLVSILSI